MDSCFMCYEIQDRLFCLGSTVLATTFLVSILVMRCRPHGISSRVSWTASSRSRRSFANVPDGPRTVSFDLRTSFFSKKEKVTEERERERKKERKKERGRESE